VNGQITPAFSQALADVLRRRREAKGMSLAKLAELAGLAQTYPGRLEKKERVPTVDVAHALARALDASCQSWSGTLKSA